MFCFSPSCRQLRLELELAFLLLAVQQLMANNKVADFKFFKNSKHKSNLKQEDPQYLKVIAESQY